MYTLVLPIPTNTPAVILPLYIKFLNAIDIQRVTYRQRPSGGLNVLVITGVNPNLNPTGTLKVLDYYLLTRPSTPRLKVLDASMLQNFW